MLRSIITTYLSTSSRRHYSTSKRTLLPRVAVRLISGFGLGDSGAATLLTQKAGAAADLPCTRLVVSFLLPELIEAFLEDLRRYKMAAIEAVARVSDLRSCALDPRFLSCCPVSKRIWTAAPAPARRPCKRIILILI